jgi:hypothetical protein
MATVALVSTSHEDLTAAHIINSPRGGSWIRPFKFFLPLNFLILKQGEKSPDSFIHNKHKFKKKCIWKHFKSPLPKSQNQILAEKEKESKLTTMRFCYFPHPLCLFPWR